MFSDQTNKYPSAMNDVPKNLQKCPSCSRKFNENAYEKHVKICEEVFIKKRKEFNMQEKRIIADEQIEL